MNAHTIRYALVAAMLTPALGAVALAQSGPTEVVPVPIRTGAQSQATEGRTPIPLRVQITIHRSQNDKRISSLPFTLWVNANDGQTTRLTTGQNIPIPQTVFNSAAAGGIANVPTTTYQYQNVGTDITARAAATTEGRFLLNLDISDTSVAGPGGTSLPDPAAAARRSFDPVSLKSLRTSNALLLRDGQSAEYVAASDKVNGEVTRIEVTLTVLK